MRLVLAPITIVILTIVNVSLGDTEQPKDYSIQFLGEDEKPIPNTLFFLYEMADGHFVRALYRDHKMTLDSRITLESLPESSRMGVISNDHFYYQWWHGIGGMFRPTFDCQPNVHLVTGVNIIKLEQTGRVAVTFSHVDPILLSRIDTSPLLVYSRMSPLGSYVRCGGIGTWPRAGEPINVCGLPPGDYRLELKPSYASDTVFWSVSGLAVQKRTLTDLKDLSAQP